MPVKPKKKNLGGRPKTRPPKPGQRIAISVRVTPSLKDKIDGAAADSGRSISQEVEARLGRSFAALDFLPEALETAFGRQLGGLLMTMGRVMYDAGSHAGFMSNPKLQMGAQQHWLTDPFAYNEAAKAVSVVIEALRPAGEIQVPPMAELFFKATGFDEIGEGFAHGVLHAVSGKSGGTADSIAFGERVRQMLGQLANIESEEKAK